MSRRAKAAIAVCGAVTLSAATAGAGIFTGPSTNIPPYLIPAATGVDLQSLFTVGNMTAGNGYRYVGIPDGMGAYRQGSNTVVLSNHELPATSGIVRAHGQEGAFVSKLTLNSNGKVVKGEDFIKTVKYFDYGTLLDNAGTYGDTAPAGFDNRLGRFCSSTLAESGRFYNPATKKGTKQRIYLTNEETGDNGRAFGVDQDGNAVQLPRLGLFSWENTVPAPIPSDTTLIMGNEDAGTATSEMWVYVGTKTKKGNAFDKAGLTNGDDHVMRILDDNDALVPDDAAFRAAYDKGDQVRFDLAEIPWDDTGAAQNAAADVVGTSLDRIEDGQWNGSDYYFVTTRGGEGTAPQQAGTGGGGLWRMHFDDVNDPDSGGTIELVLDGTEGINMVSPDNLTIDTHGNMLIQEDPGANDDLARIVAYRISDGALGEVARFDPNLFTPGAQNFLTRDEESSGIIDLEPAGHPAGTFLFDTQVHTATGLAADPDPALDNPGTVDEYVERGQLIKLTIADFASVYTVFPPVG